MNRFKSPIITILISSFFIISTCTTDNSITGNTNQTVGKTTGVVDVNSDDESDPYTEALDNCLFILYLLDLEYLAPFQWNPSAKSNSSSFDISKSFEFRDNFLSKSEKGNEYIASYYILSKYGIENNLVNKYYKEHFELLQNSIEIAYDLQYGSNNDQILVNKSTSEALKDILKVYRNSLNHKEIDAVLDYLEADLEKYYNKPKYEIAADFNSN